MMSSLRPGDLRKFFDETVARRRFDAIRSDEDVTHLSGAILKIQLYSRLPALGLGVRDESLVCELPALGS